MALCCRAKLILRIKCRFMRLLLYSIETWPESFTVVSGLVDEIYYFKSKMKRNWRINYLACTLLYWRDVLFICKEHKGTTKANYLFIYFLRWRSSSGLMVKHSRLSPWEWQIPCTAGKNPIHSQLHKWLSNAFALWIVSFSLKYPW